MRNGLESALEFGMETDWYGFPVLMVTENLD